MKAKIFTEWVKRIGDKNSFYTITEQDINAITETWDDWEDALISWGVITGDESEEEFEGILSGLDPEAANHILEAIGKRRVKDES